ncbi:MAG: site-specific DNA-methyltransferase, partial [Bacteroidaceae bacterium]|nr:site-specific DNA-methyltransferase [Bacteroidaceae bacterium]
MIQKNITPVSSIKHDAEKRASIPTTELAGEEQMAAADLSPEGQYKSFKNDFTRGRDPEIYWLGKYRNDDDETKSPDLKVDTRSLYVHEDIQPEMLINKLYTLKEENAQPRLFSDDEIPTAYEDELKRIAEYYQHNAEWKNRLIQGDSLLVMNSLLQREGMAGKVQCVYIDPPYGIRFGSNWQVNISKPKMSHESKDDECCGEPEMIKAFRDTWELGIHSYLSYLRDRLVCARELLNETGSCFVQISDENVHLVRNLMDEVFGSDNFICQIFYKKTSGAGSPGELIGPASVGDYIVWYAKNKDSLKFRKLYCVKEFGGEGSTPYRSIELPNGKRISIPEWEKQYNKQFEYSKMEKGCKVFTLDNLTSQSGGDIGRFDIEFEGKTYTIPGNGVWKTNYAGIERLKELRRIDVSSNGRVGYVRYFEDFPYQLLTSLWTDSGSSFMEKYYVVQSSIKAIQRCILMTTDPGDLVLDPTCGSGTTAFVAEQWGRRWITIDTSRIALNIAKKRLTTAIFPYYKLFDKDGGNIRQGFIYKTVPHITLKSLANDLPADEEILYDQPEEDKKKIRVAGPFTVETLQSFNVVDPALLEGSEADETLAFQERIFAHLKSSGIRNGAKNEQAVFQNIEAVANPYINAKGYYRDAEDKEKLAYFLIGPKFGTVSKRAVSMALQEFRPKVQTEGASWLVLLGFSFEDNINEADYKLGTYTVSKVRMHDDLMQDGLLKKDKGAGSFITIGEPDITLVDDEGGDTCHIEIHGLDIYDPIKDIVKPRSVEDIAYWEVDDN